MRLWRTLALINNIPSLQRQISGHSNSTLTLNDHINHLIRKSQLIQARKLFDENPQPRNTVTWNSIINGYIKSHQTHQAKTLFDNMPNKDIISWNTILSGYRDLHDPRNAHQHFLQMMRHGMKPNELTFAVFISTLLGSEYNVLVPQLHCLVICLGVGLNAFLGSALMRGYVGVGDREGFPRVFGEIVIKDIAPWNVLILGYMGVGSVSEAQRAFDLMPEKNAYSWSILINGYIENGMGNEAQAVFNKMMKKDVVSWTAMIKGYLRFGKFNEAIELFVSMMGSGIRPNHYTFSSLLDACAGSSSLITGTEIHACILKYCIPLDVILGTALVDMYAKCGDIEAAFCIFESMLMKNLVTWNSIIGGYARHGLATRALQEFERMVMVGVKPDEVSFVNVLSACVHGGMVEQGQEIFESMEVDYGVRPRMEHYACMVDLYGRAGELEKAKELIEGMPCEPDVAIWGALLGACGLHSSFKIGETAANAIYELQRDHPAVYEVLSRMHGENGAWSVMNELKDLMRKRGSKKQKGGSWVEASSALV